MRTRNSLGGEFVDPNGFRVVTLRSQLAEAWRGLMFKRIGAIALATSMFVSTTAFAVSNANQGALTQGQAATVKQAESYHGKKYVWWLLGAGIVIGGIALVSGGDSHGLIGTTTTCPFGGCPPPPPPPPPPNTNTTTTTSTTTGT